MALSGTLAEFDISNIFLLIEQDGKTGKLIISSSEDTKTIVFKNGMIINASSNSEDIKEFIFRYLQQVKGFSAMETKELNSLFYKNLHLLSDELVKKGYLTNQDLTTLVQTAIIDITCSVFDMEHGNYIFEPAPNMDASQYLNIAVPTNFVTFEAARRTDEWVNIGSVITDDTIFDTNIHISTPQVHQPIGNFSLYAISFVDGKRTVGDICQEVFFSSFHVYKAMDEALRDNKITLINAPTMPAGNLKRRLSAKENEDNHMLYIVLASTVTMAFSLIMVLGSFFILHQNIWKEKHNGRKQYIKYKEAEVAQKKVDCARLLYQGDHGSAPKNYYRDLKGGNYVTTADIDRFLRAEKQQ